MAANTTSPVRWGDLAEAIRAKLDVDHLTLDQAAEQIGTSAASLSRILNRKSTPNSDSFALLTTWLGVPTQRFMEQPPEAVVHNIAHYVSESTPQIVRAHLRADKNLSPETASALSEAFNALYRHYSQQS